MVGPKKGWGRRWLDWADSLLIPVICLMALVVSLRIHRGWEIGKLLSTDGEGYYTYLPATFIYGDWREYDGHDGLQPLDGCAVDSSGLVVTRYTYGVALLELPFFLGAHAWVSATQGAGSTPPADWGQSTDPKWPERMNLRRYSDLRGYATGYSDGYAYAMSLSAIFYMAAGLWWLKRALRRSFRKEVALVTTGLIALATNLFYYTAGEGSMSHVYSFFLFAMVVYQLPEWLRNPTWGRSLTLGICLGLIVLIRPTNLILALLVPLWEVYRGRDLVLRLRELWLQRWKLSGMAACVFLVLVPQGIYWKMAFGSFVAWSYGGEGFSNWSHPEMLKVLFSHQNGLFMYTPIMLLAIVGIVMGWLGKQGSALVIGILFLVATYTFGSWWAWWFGGAFGHRCYVEWYALLSLPLAIVVRWWCSPGKTVRMVLGMLLGAIFIYANLKMTMMYSGPWDGPEWTFERYLDIWHGVARVGWWPGF